MSRRRKDDGDSDIVAAALRHGERRALREGEVLFREGDAGDAAYVLLGGVIEIDAANRHLRQVRPGEMFGEMAFFDGQSRSGTATSLSASEIVRIPYESFDRLLQENFAVAKRLMAQLSRMVRDLNRIATTDPLTGCFARGHLMTVLEREVARCGRQRAPLSLVFIDVDNFKAVNDTFGHGEGDELLLAVARYLQEAIRRTDLLGRYGGDEFCVVLPDTPVSSCRLVMQRFLKVIDSAPLRAVNARLPPERAVSLSLGAADLDAVGDATASALVAAADAAVYAAKRAGKGRGVIAAGGKELVVEA
jgi:diguanylate cyclase (GGDEF)-like protein